MVLDIDVKNVVLFVDDAVRYDVSHELLAQRGQTHPTITASLHTPASFSSIFSGYHVPTHNVTSFREIFDDSLFNLFRLNQTSDYNVGLSPLRGMNKSIGRLFPNTNFKAHTDIEPPFIWLHRGPGGHAPYGEYEYPDGYKNDRKANEYLNTFVGQNKRLLDDYRQGIRNSINYFDKIHTDFLDRGFKDDTLFIYTSDHGEILGEYGFLGHNHLACPELVKVPTSFLHPNIEATYDDRLLHNVDMIPIILDILDVDYPDVDGLNSLIKPREYGYNHFENMFYTSGLNSLNRAVKSVWDESGGYVKVEGTKLQLAFIYAGLLLKSVHGKQIRKSNKIIEAYKRFVGSQTYGDPGFSGQDAENLIDLINSRGHKSTNHRDLSEDELEHLQDLGYV